MAATAQAKRFPRDIAAFPKANPRADWMCHAGGAGHASRREDALWYSCRWNGTPQSAVEEARACGFEDAWAQRQGFTWLYLRRAGEGEGTKEQP